MSDDNKVIIGFFVYYALGLIVLSTMKAWRDNKRGGPQGTLIRFGLVPEPGVMIPSWAQRVTQWIGWAFVFQIWPLAAAKLLHHWKTDMEWKNDKEGTS